MHIRLSWRCDSMGCEPRDNVGNLFIGHSSRTSTRPVRTPIGHSIFRLPGDDQAAQSLVADERKIRRINKRTHGTLFTFRSGPIAPVTTGTEGDKRRLSLFWISSRGVGVRRDGLPLKYPRLSPGGLHSLCQDRNLLVRQHAALVLGKRRHQRSRDTVCGRFLDHVDPSQSEIDGICQRNRSAMLSIRTMTGCAVLLIQHAKI